LRTIWSRYSDCVGWVSAPCCPDRPRRNPLPGHGPDLANVEAVAAGYLAHREQRLEQVRSALSTLGDQATARQVVEHVYVDVDEELWDVAEWSVQAQLDYLRR
jgi:hypothetical protein